MSGLADLQSCGTTTVNYLEPGEQNPFFDVKSQSENRIAFDPRAVPIHDARPIAGEVTLERDGFKLLRYATRLRREDFRTPQYVTSVYLREIERAIQDATGAELVVAANAPIVRLNSEDAEQQNLVKPAAIAHADYTAVTLRELMAQDLPIAAPGFRQFKRVVAYQTWRVLSPPPQDNTLMFCDPASVDPQDLMVGTFLAPPQMVMLEFKVARYNPAHRWCFVSGLGADELLLFKGFEAGCDERLNVLHGGFPVPNSGSTTPRESVEARAYAFFRD